MAGEGLPLNTLWKNKLEVSASEQRSPAPAVAKETTAIISWMKYVVSRYGLSRDTALPDVIATHGKTDWADIMEVTSYP